MRADRHPWGERGSPILETLIALICSTGVLVIYDLDLNWSMCSYCKEFGSMGVGATVDNPAYFPGLGLGQSEGESSLNL